MTIERAVLQTGKNNDGDITALCNRGQSWSPRATADAIRDIESQLYSYHVPMEDGRKTLIHVVNGKYLRTNWDNTDKNNLDDLPDC